MKKGLTIGQAATFAGVTIKTVRHYHKLGLVPEPERDDSDYRRYSSTHLLRLVQVRTLAEAGVPLAEINGSLNAAPEEFAASIQNVQDDLSARIEELTRRRDSLKRLMHGNRVMLPERAYSVLDTFTELGFKADYVAAQEESLVLFRALLPEHFDDFLGQLEGRLNDPVQIELEQRAWEATHWEPNDPRLEKLAGDLSANLLARHLQVPAPNEWHTRADVSARYELINHHRGDELPTLARLSALIDANLRRAGLDIPDEPVKAKRAGSGRETW